MDARKNPKYIPPPKWKKGESGNPSGKPKTPQDIIEAKKATNFEAQRYLHEALRSTISELVAIAKDKKTPALQMIMVTMTLEAIKERCERKCAFLLDRAGMVVDKAPLIAMQINNAKESDINLEAIDPEKLATLLMEETNATQGRPQVIPLEEGGTVLET